MKIEKKNYPQVYLEIKKINDVQIHKHWAWIRIRVRVRTWFWMVVIFSTCNNVIYSLLLFWTLVLRWLLLAPKITTKFPWEKLDACAFLGHHVMSPALHPGFQTCKDLHQLWALPWHEATFCLFQCLGIQFFCLHSHVTYRTLCHARGHSDSCLRKQRISLSVTIILSICLCSYT